jgi:hypothetical protein
MARLPSISVSGGATLGRGRRHRVTMRQLGGAMHTVVDRRNVPDLQTALRYGVVMRLWREINSYNVRDTSKYLASHNVSIGAPQPLHLPTRKSYRKRGDQHPQRVLKSAPPSATVSIVNDATSADSFPYAAAAIEPGRRVNSRGRPIGSPDAPRGVYGPALATVARQRRQIAAEAVAKASG